MLISNQLTMIEAVTPHVRLSFRMMQDRYICRIGVRIRVQRRLMIQTMIGGIIWLGSIVLLQVGQIEALLSFAMLVLVPLALYLLFRGSTFPVLEKSLVILQLPCALAGLISVAVDPGMIAGIFALGWVIYTVLCFVYGSSRIARRGLKPIEETVIDVALIYIVVGGGWLFLHRLAVQGIPFPSVIVLLTAIHFHYAAFLLLTFTGLLGRYRYAHRMPMRTYTIVAVGLIIGPMLVAAGITFGGWLDLLFVFIYVLIAYAFSIVTIQTMMRGSGSIWGRTFVSISSLVLFITLALSFLYSFGNVTGKMGLSIPTMVIFHGIGNAVGFGACGIVGWLLLQAQPRDRYDHFPISRLRGKGKVGASFLAKDELFDSKRHVTGLVDRFEQYASESFQPSNVHRLIHLFYEETARFKLYAKTKWHVGFRMFSRLFYRLSGWMGQLHIEPFRDQVVQQEMGQTLHPVKESEDGRSRPRAWIRHDTRTHETIFVAIYSEYVHRGERYMNIALPLPGAVMTGILRAENDAHDGLVLTSVRRHGMGHAGIYLTIGKWTIKLPLSETFHLQAKSDRRLTATHRMKICGIHFLTIDYDISLADV